MKAFDTFAKILVIVGGLNWGLVGLFQFDLVAALFGGQDSMMSRIVYSLVGIAAVFLAIRWATKPEALSTSSTAGAH